MKKMLWIVSIVIFINVMWVVAFLFGTTQAETKEVIPPGYISLNDCISLEDIACYFIDEYDYPCFELKDVGNQLDDDNNRSYVDIMEALPDETEDCQNNFVDMQSVVDFYATENGLQLYFEDGTGYYNRNRLKRNM